MTAAKMLCYLDVDRKGTPTTWWWVEARRFTKVVGRGGGGICSCYFGSLCLCLRLLVCDNIRY